MLHYQPREYLIYTVAEARNHTNDISYITKNLLGEGNILSSLGPPPPPPPPTPPPPPRRYHNRPQGHRKINR